MDLRAAQDTRSALLPTGRSVSPALPGQRLHRALASLCISAIAAGCGVAPGGPDDRATLTAAAVKTGAGYKEGTFSIADAFTFKCDGKTYRLDLLGFDEKSKICPIKVALNDAIGCASEETHWKRFPAVTLAVAQLEGYHLPEEMVRSVVKKPVPGDDAAFEVLAVCAKVGASANKAEAAADSPKAEATAEAELPEGRPEEIKEAAKAEASDEAAAAADADAADAKAEDVAVLKGSSSSDQAGPATGPAVTTGIPSLPQPETRGENFAPATKTPAVTQNVTVPASAPSTPVSATYTICVGPPADGSAQWYRLESAADSNVFVEGFAYPKLCLSIRNTASGTGSQQTPTVRLTAHTVSVPPNGSPVMLRLGMCTLQQGSSPASCAPTSFRVPQVEFTRQ